MSKVIFEKFYGIWKDGQNTNEFPMCPKCGEPTYSNDKCPFCGEPLEYEEEEER
jgi:rubrerythrin